jgi:hypothetical protein
LLVAWRRWRGRKEGEAMAVIGRRVARVVYREETWWFEI